MNVFISYSNYDSKYAKMIAKKLRDAGHNVCNEMVKINSGDNLISKINQSLKEFDSLIMIVSRNSVRSKWVNYEFSTFALGNLSGKDIRIIPVLVDKSTVPEYIARFKYLDLSENFLMRLDNLVHALSEQPTTGPKPRTDRKRSYEKGVNDLSDALQTGRLTLVCGAGVSKSAGIPSWDELLLRLLQKMIWCLSKHGSMLIADVEPRDFLGRYAPSPLVVGRYLKSNLGDDFIPELRDALYSENPTSCDIIKAIVDLSRPQRNGKKPLDSIVTFNFDNLIEEELASNNIRYKAIHEESMRDGSNELPIYHVHGYLPRKGQIKKNTEVVFSEDAYHSQFIDPFSWSNLIQLNKMNQNTCLFLGLSLTDPNLRRLLDVAYRKNLSKQLNHYVIKKYPSFSVKNDTVDDLALLLEERDANELGLNVIWIKDFDEVAPLLRRIAEDGA